MQMNALLAVLAVSLVVQGCLGGGSSWEHLGPRNIFDDDSNHGEAGTLATASTPAGSPHIIYTGGMNNGASSGVMKTVDMGMHWVQASKGSVKTPNITLEYTRPRGGEYHAQISSETTDLVFTWYCDVQPTSVFLRF